MTHEHVDSVEHAEPLLARTGAQRLDAQRLWRCTLVTTVEPCAMCAGPQYGAHSGRLVSGMSMAGAEAEIAALHRDCWMRPA
jgi:tRNA(Arg) A34 adenosine deaminase TadA